MTLASQNYDILFKCQVKVESNGKRETGTVKWFYYCSKLELSFTTVHIFTMKRPQKSNIDVLNKKNIAPSYYLHDSFLKIDGTNGS